MATDMQDMVPVFDRDKRILGYLDADRVPYRTHSFSLATVQQLRPVDISVPLEMTAAVASCTFEWAEMGCARSRDDKHLDVYHCRVLIANEPDILADIRGFHWFAEVHGKLTENIRKTMV